MMNLPVILCRLCDKSGKILDPYDPNSIRFTELTKPGERPQRIFCIGKITTLNMALIMVEGYVAVSLDGRNLSAPIPFKILQRIWIYAPQCATLSFTENNFICQARFTSDCFIRLRITIETLVRSKTGQNSDDKQPDMFGCMNKTIDAVRMVSRCCLLYGISHIQASQMEYNALADGVKRIYTNADDLKGYGGTCIMPPEDVSYYNLYVNGVLQPKADYIMSKGRLEFVTDDLPQKDQTVLLRYIVFWNKKEVCVTDYQYFAISNGQKQVYTNDDALKKYGDHGIPGPDEVSYYNLFVNGVLQPQENYEVKKGQLVILTEDIPRQGQSIILESVVITDSCGRFLRVGLYQYDTLSESQRIYNSGDDLSYGDGILGPCQSSYQNLFINAVNQPEVDYKILDGNLVLITVDLPTKEAPVSMQSVVVQNDAIYRTFCGCWCML